MSRAERLEREAASLRTLATAMKEVRGEAEQQLHSILWDAFRNRG